MAKRTLAFDVDEEFHREIKVKIAQEGKTLKGYVLGLIEQDLHPQAAQEEVDNGEQERAVEISIAKVKESLDELLAAVRAAKER